jgi:hypothetical protein
MNTDQKAFSENGVNVSLKNFFDYARGVGILLTLTAWALLACGIGGTPALLSLAVSCIGSVLYVSQQRRLCALGRAYPRGEGLFVACLLSFAALAANVWIMLHYFPVLTVVRPH